MKICTCKKAFKLYSRVNNMAIYSHSRLGTFQQCKYKYKLQYIDRIKVDIPDTVETFMGSLVHETLEKLYKDLKYNKLNTKEDLIKFYELTWNNTWTNKILINNKDYTQENYKGMGSKFISNYYDRYAPFNQNTIIGLETQDTLELENGNRFHVRIDKLCCDKDGNYYVCDYKTNNTLKSQSEIDDDRQLAMYSLWVKQNFKDCKNIKLVWHFLAFDKELVSERNDEQLLRLKAETEELIKEVENCNEFPAQSSALCGWCKFQKMCPTLKHKFDVEEKKKSFKEEDGAKLVDEFSKLDSSKKEVVSKIEAVKKDIIEFSKQKNVSVVFGTEKKCSVKEHDKVVFPEDKEALMMMLKNKGLYDEFSSISYVKLGPRILKGEVDKDIIDLTSKDKAHRLS